MDQRNLGRSKEAHLQSPSAGGQARRMDCQEEEAKDGPGTSTTPTKLRQRLSEDIKELKIQDGADDYNTETSEATSQQDRSEGGRKQHRGTKASMKRDRRQLTKNDEQTWMKHLPPLLFMAAQLGTFVLAWTISPDVTILPSLEIPGPPMPLEIINLNRRIFGRDIAVASGAPLPHHTARLYGRKYFHFVLQLSSRASSKMPSAYGRINPSLKSLPEQLTRHCPSQDHKTKSASRTRGRFHKGEGEQHGCEEDGGTANQAGPHFASRPLRAFYYHDRQCPGRDYNSHPTL
ncbi:hypothetical protein CBR_g17742 [Chara braunii]|uniref:Uncharacterized protein n=1 Tax=Chara braunii TaxID=69332 RepID=A0A388KVM8_CHABU|nr:hypothetical protein CBR_g17742 [Chara braunii]|eukprot:GBG74032.1 hypothetical protein CBR_g17742 [Chara braunii]